MSVWVFSGFDASQASARKQIAARAKGNKRNAHGRYYSLTYFRSTKYSIIITHSNYQHRQIWPCWYELREYIFMLSLGSWRT